MTGAQCPIFFAFSSPDREISEIIRILTISGGTVQIPEQRNCRGTRARQFFHPADSCFPLLPQLWSHPVILCVRGMKYSFVKRLLRGRFSGIRPCQVRNRNHRLNLRHKRFLRNSNLFRHFIIADGASECIDCNIHLRHLRAVF